MKLRFPLSDVTRYAREYEAGPGQRERELTEKVTREVMPAYRARGFLTRDEFLTVCKWKTPRTEPRCRTNHKDTIKDISQLVLSTQSEALRIQAWTLLIGVKWPTASVFLHFTFEDRYPILDFRALWSLGIENPEPYTLQRWETYVRTCRMLAADAGVSMRVLDQSLWMFSKLHQK
ncbi:MAG: hypothetical protein WBM14_06115 [Terracidiphilus sp.]